uniref:Uncharacterized protein n=1 Tax=Neobodo designis TaxID=312471 RepID=A0A7S1Q914_NEODS
MPHHDTPMRQSARGSNTTWSTASGKPPPAPCPSALNALRGTDFAPPPRPSGGPVLPSPAPAGSDATQLHAAVAADLTVPPVRGGAAMYVAYPVGNNVAGASIPPQLLSPLAAAAPEIGTPRQSWAPPPPPPPPVHWANYPPPASHWGPPQLPPAAGDVAVFRPPRAASHREQRILLDPRPVVGDPHREQTHPHPRAAIETVQPPLLPPEPHFPAPTASDAPNASPTPSQPSPTAVRPEPPILLPSSTLPQQSRAASASSEAQPPLHPHARPHRRFVHDPYPALSRAGNATTGGPATRPAPLHPASFAGSGPPASHDGASRDGALPRGCSPAPKAPDALMSAAQQGSTTEGQLLVPDAASDADERDIPVVQAAVGTTDGGKERVPVPPVGVYTLIIPHDDTAAMPGVITIGRGDNHPKKPPVPECHLKLGGCCERVPPIVIAHFIELLSGVRVAAVVFDGSRRGLARCALRNPIADRARITHALHKRAWMAPDALYWMRAAEGPPPAGPGTASEHDPVPAEAAALQSFVAAVGGTSSVRCPTHLLTCTAWSQSSPRGEAAKPRRRRGGKNST